jgi:hypothetical protein
LKPKLILLLLAFLLTLTVAGCAKVEATKRSNQFQQTLKDFNASIRWGYFEQARTFINMREGVPRELDLDYLQEIRVTRYDITRKTAIGDNLQDPREVVIDVAIDYYHDSTLRVKSIKYQQMWWYDDVAKQWFLDADLPDFKQ